MQILRICVKFSKNVYVGIGFVGVLNPNVDCNLGLRLERRRLGSNEKAFVVGLDNSN